MIKLPKALRDVTDSFRPAFTKPTYWPWRAARILSRLVIEAFAPHGVIYLAGDDTVDEYPGDHVCGKGCHRARFVRR